MWSVVGQVCRRAGLPSSSSTKPARVVYACVNQRRTIYGNYQARMKKMQDKQKREVDKRKAGAFQKSWPPKDPEGDKRKAKKVSGDKAGIFANQGRTNSRPGEMLSSKLAELAVPESVKQNLLGLGIRSLTEIQRAAFLPILRGRSFVGRAKTGTGKTAAYLIPIFERMRVERISGKGSVLILVPTRELCKQVGSMALSINPSADLVLLYSSELASGQDQMLRTGATVIVATPARLHEVIKRDQLNLSNVRTVVIDEVDAMLLRSYEGKLKSLLSKLPKTAQVALFSASMPPEVGNLIETHFGSDFVKDVVVCDLVTTKVSKNSRAKLPNNQPSSVIDNGKMDHVLYKVESMDLNERVRSAVHVLHAFNNKKGEGNLPRTMIFVSCSKEAVRVASHPVFDRSAKCFHIDMPQAKRDSVLNRYMSQEFPVLICTDLAARGLDIEDVEIVIQLHPPKEPMTYVHRAGRTGRAGKSGTSALLYAFPEHAAIQNIKTTENVPFRTESLPGEQELHAASVTRVLESIHDVPFEDYQFVLKRAERLVKEYGNAPLSAAMAILDGRATKSSTKPEETFSYLGGQQGFVTVMFADPSGEKIKTKNEMYDIFAKHVPALYKNKIKALGAVQLSTGGYVADIHCLYADELLYGNTKGKFRQEVGVEPIAVTEMPRIVVDKSDKKEKKRNLPWNHMKQRIFLKKRKARTERGSTTKAQVRASNASA